jgi:hypothetical protein
VLPKLHALFSLLLVVACILPVELVHQSRVEFLFHFIFDAGADITLHKRLILIEFDLFPVFFKIFVHQRLGEIIAFNCKECGAVSILKTKRKRKKMNCLVIWRRINIGRRWYLLHFSSEFAHGCESRSDGIFVRHVIASTAF